MDPYFLKTEYYSNSMFSKIAAEMNGNPLPERDASFFKTGNKFEDSLLYKKPSEDRMIRAMVRETNKNTTFAKIFSDPRLKIQHEFYGKFMGLPFKAKADMVIKGFIVPDIKSTSCNNQDQFYKSIVEYNYDRQMYIYMEVFKCPLSCLIGVSKSMNPKLFIVPIEKGSYLWNTGKEKTESIVSIIKSL